jgi:hypothetical protein
MEDPAGKISQMTGATLRDLPPADAAARVSDGQDEEVLTDIESLLEE